MLYTRCTDSVKTWQGRRARGSVWLCKISPQSPQAVGMRPPNIENFHFLVKSRLADRNPFDRFLIFLGTFIRPTILRQHFKFDLILFTGYGDIAEKPRVGQFSVHPVGKLCVGSKKMNGTFLTNY